MKKEVAALRIGRELTASETGIDTVLAQLGQLMSEVATARVATDSTAATGHRAIARLAQAQVKMIEARFDVIRAHEDLRRIAETADVPTDCPEEVFTGAELGEDLREAA